MRSTPAIPEIVRVLLTITDVTEAKAASKQQVDLLREKAVLLQEIQHRVANSLQIIASVLMQSARKVQSEETRGHLKSAHGRVMSIAAVQRLLSVSASGMVEVKPYLDQLCGSLAASMIADNAQLTVVVNADGSYVDATTSVSLGLIVTELVINALKHAFADERGGKIMVGYRTSGVDWALTVRDDGMGMSEEPEKPKAGLGTSLVHALADRLKAVITVSPGRPGTIITIDHREGSSADATSKDIVPAI